MLFNIKHDQATDNTIVLNAMHLALRGIVRCSCQSVIIGPKILFDNNFLCNLGEDFAKQLAATNKKGVVGNTGNAAPKIAKPTNKQPINFNSIKFLLKFNHCLPYYTIKNRKRLFK